MDGLSSNRMATHRYRLSLALLAFLGPAAAYADSPACAAGDTSLNCRLLELLHWLEATALVLAIILVAVIAIAIHLYRKNRLSRKGGR